MINQDNIDFPLQLLLEKNHVITNLFISNCLYNVIPCEVLWLLLTLMSISSNIDCWKI